MFRNNGCPHFLHIFIVFIETGFWQGTGNTGAFFAAETPRKRRVGGDFTANSAQIPRLRGEDFAGTYVAVYNQAPDAIRFYFFGGSLVPVNFTSLTSPCAGAFTGWLAG